MLGEAGSGVLVTRPLEIASTVRRVELADGFETKIRLGAATASGRVTIDDNLLDNLEVATDDEMLHVELNGRVRRATLKLEIALPALTTLEVSGASSVEVQGTLSDRAEIVVAGASRVGVQAVDLKRLDLDVSGASRLEAGGVAREIRADASGASELDLARVEAEEVVLTASGASTVDVAVSELLDVEASGASTVRYRGDSARVLVDASGASTVERA